MKEIHLHRISDTLSFQIIKLIFYFLLIIFSTFSYSIFYWLNIKDNYIVLGLSWLIFLLASYFILSRFILKKEFINNFKASYNHLQIYLSILFLISGIAAILLQHTNYSLSKLIFIIIIGVCCEEIIFRGIIWDIVSNIKLKQNPVLLIIITSILFSIQHTQYNNYN
jgi:membrane protease YdiL (CAAX protease family)